MSSDKLATVDVIASMASDLQTLLEEGKAMSQILVETYLAQIDIMGPAHRAGLFALKPHVGSMPMGGTYALTEWDSIRALATSAEDLTDLVNIVMVPSPAFDTAEMKKTTWEGLRIGFVDPDLWPLPESICARDDQIHSKFVSVTELKVDVYAHSSQDDAFRMVRKYPVEWCES